VVKSPWVSPVNLTEAARLSGAVIVEHGGTFSGNGLVEGYLQFSGLLSPGQTCAPGSNLAVVGDIAGGGTLYSNIWADGNSNKVIGNSSLFLNNTTVYLSDLAGGNNLPQPKYLLAQGNNLTGRTANDIAVSRQGVILQHDFSLEVQNNALYAHLVFIAARHEAKSLSEGFVSSLTLVN
jgi:hypothetical protein